MNKKAILVLIYSILICISFVNYIPIVNAANNDGTNEGEYYFALGDSITAGKEIDNCVGSFTYSKVFISQMVSKYDSGKSVDHVSDVGAGKESDWGIANWNTWYKNNSVFCFMFGNNDCAVYNNGSDTNYTPEKYANNMMEMYNMSIANGSSTYLMAMIGYWYDVASGDWWVNPDNWIPYITTAMNIWKNHSIPYVPAWDAIDENPWDGVVQQGDNNSYNCYPTGSRSHIDETAHGELGDLLWYFIQGWDYNTTYYSGNNTMIVDADYNETIFINNSYWDNSSINVTCLDNDTIISHTMQTDYFSNDIIRFDIQKGYTYSITDSTSSSSNTSPFIDICGLTNNSNLFTGTRWGNITVPTASDIDGIDSDDQILSVEEYYVRIDNSSNFNSPFINESGLNQWFNLTNTVDYYGTHYYNAGFKVKVVSD